MASKKAALGRGLNALLPSREHEAEAGDEEANSELGRSRLYPFDERARLIGRVADVDVDQIRPNPYQPRKEFDEKALDELAASILQLGVIQPITVRALGEGRFEIISGERRLRAARRAGLKRLPAYIREADTEEMLEMALVENVQREELNPIEVALAFQRLIEECNLTQEVVAQKVGKNRATVANMLRLLKLPPRVQAGLRDGSLSVGHARALIPIDDAEVQGRMANEIVQKELSVREVEERVRQWHQSLEQSEKEPQASASGNAASERPDRDSLQLDAFISRLRSHLSTQVQIRRRQEGGRIEIAFYTDEDLERLMELLVGR